MQQPYLQFFFFLVSLIRCSGGADWCYHSQFTCSSPCKTPEKWHEVHGNSCGGRAQSPINIVTKKTLPDGRLGPFKFTKYQESFHSTIKNNGHTVQINIPHGAIISGGNLETSYRAVQLHLHWGKDGGPGSEHTVDGEQYPMELHVVHMKETHSTIEHALRDPTGIAVLGFFYEESATPNRKYEPIINVLQRIRAKNSNVTIDNLSLDSLIPAQSKLTHYFRYKGSLTTPNCNESVVWTVFEQPIPLSNSQLLEFSKLQFGNGTAMTQTYRPVQPLNGRRVYYSSSTAVLVSTNLLVSTLLVSVGFSCSK